MSNIRMFVLVRNYPAKWFYLRMVKIHLHEQKNPSTWMDEHIHVDVDPFAPQLARQH